MSANTPEIKADCDDWCRIVARKSVKTSFTYRIENFLDVLESCYLVSGRFSVTGPDDKKTKWEVVLEPTDVGNDHVYVFVYETLELPQLTSEDAAATFFIVDGSGNEHETLGPYTFLDDDGDESHWGGKLIKLDNLRNNSSTLLPEGNLNIRCKLEVFGKTEVEIYSGSQESFDKNQINEECQKQVINHLDNLFTEMNLADVEITCDGEVFNCHQTILSARSPVFLAMFRADMSEKHSKKVHIQDVKKEVFLEVLKFIYTGNVPSEDSLKEQAREILAASNKYEIDLLKKVCEAQLVSALDASNCLDLLVLGDLHEAEKLKMVALDFVSTNFPSLVQQDVYKDFLRQYPDLVFEVTMSVASKMQSNKTID